MKIIFKILFVFFLLAILLAAFKTSTFSFVNPIGSREYQSADYRNTSSSGYNNQAGYDYYAADYKAYLPSKGTGLGYQETYYDNTSGQRFYSGDLNQYAKYNTSNKVGYAYFVADQEDFGEYNDPNTGYKYYSGGKKPFR